MYKVMTGNIAYIPQSNGESFIWFSTVSHCFTPKCRSSFVPLSFFKYPFPTQKLHS